MKQFLTDLPASLPAIAITLAFVAGLWWTIDKLTPFDDQKELFKKSNWAYLVQRLALISGQVIAMLAVIPDFDASDPWWSSFWLFTEGAWVFIALLLARPIVDFILLRRTKNTDLLLQGNLAIGIVEAAFYVSLGILLNGSLTGTGPTLLSSIVSTVGFYVLGVMFVFGVDWLQELVTRYNMRERLADGDIGAALELGGFLLGTSIVVRVGVAGDYTDLGESLGWFFITALISVILLYAVRILVTGLLLGAWSVRGVSQYRSLTVVAAGAGIMVLSGIVVATLISSR